MRKITLQQHIQPNGSIHHVSGNGCPLEPCVVKLGWVDIEIYCIDDC